MILSAASHNARASAHSGRMIATSAAAASVRAARRVMAMSAMRKRRV
jgi:hypothetical protein